MKRTAVLCAVGLTPDVIGSDTPRLSAWAAGAKLAHVGGVLPAVTTSVQSTYLTGTLPARHGIVGNGWYFRDLGEVRLWLQSNRLVEGPKLWDVARERDPGFTVANLCWWYAMHSSVDYVVTPRPMYPADGRKLPDCHTRPASLRDRLQAELGTFPLFKFWGPATSIESTRWIADAATRVDEWHAPSLSLVYLPHLDYVLQREGPAGPSVPAHLRELDDVLGDLIDHYERHDVRVVVLSEYGIAPVRTPVHVNRALREAGLLAVREELGRDVFDPSESAAFAVADHQVAHVYVRDSDRVPAVADLVAALPGVDVVLDGEGKRAQGLDHPRSGDLVAVAAPEAWFTYYYWLDDERAPDYARTVDIHRKPGYDPVELFLDPELRVPQLRIARKVARSKLGMRYLMDVIGLDATVVRGSHGRRDHPPGSGPLLMTRNGELLVSDRLAATDVHDVLLAHLELG